MEEEHRRLESEKEEANTAKEGIELEMARFAEEKKFAEEEEKKQSSILCRKLEELKKEINEIKSASKMEDVSGDIVLLQKHLKLEKMQLKHYKKVASFENKGRRLLELELSRFKQDFFQLANRLNLLDGCIEGVDASVKIHGSNENNRSSVESSAPMKPISGKI